MGLCTIAKSTMVKKTMVESTIVKMTIVKKAMVRVWLLGEPREKCNGRMAADSGWHG